MPTYVSPTTEYLFAKELSRQRVVNEREVMLGQDALRPDPVTMALRRGIAAVGRLIRREQEPAPAVTIVPPAGNAPVHLPDRAIRDRAA